MLPSPPSHGLLCNFIHPSLLDKLPRGVFNVCEVRFRDDSGFIERIVIKEKFEKPIMKVVNIRSCQDIGIGIFLDDVLYVCLLGYDAWWVV